MASAKRVWTHNTNYPGAARVHSEDGSSTHARNQVVDQTSAAAISAEEEILRKKMQSLGISRKSIEKSMLSYSKKMKEIAVKREQTVTEMEKQASSSNKSTPSPGLNNGTRKSGNNAHRKNSLRPLLLNTKDDSMSDTRAKNHASEDTLPSASLESDQRGRFSVDSGVGLDTDSCLSECDSIAGSKSKNGGSVHSDDSSWSSPRRKKLAKKRSLNSKKRLRRPEKGQLATVIDAESESAIPVVKEEEKREDKELEQDEEKSLGEKLTAETDESITIFPFPYGVSDFYPNSSPSRLGSISEHGECLDDTDDVHRTRILDPIRASPIRRWKPSNSPTTNKKTAHILTKPKVVYSPSLAAMRLRRLQQRMNKKKSKPNHHHFRYSDAVETALRSLNNSPEGRRDSILTMNNSPCMSPDLPGLDLCELLNEVIQRPFDREILLSDEPEEIKPHRLLRERSFSEPLFKSDSLAFTSTLEQVREDDDAELKSVLKKSSVQYPAMKKNVQFFLPDIFMRANACTSRPTALK